MFIKISFFKLLIHQGFASFGMHQPVKVSINNFIHSVHMSMRMPGC